jgi:hypothetical protein
MKRYSFILFLSLVKYFNLCKTNLKFLRLKIFEDIMILKHKEKKGKYLLAVEFISPERRYFL